MEKQIYVSRLYRGQPSELIYYQFDWTVGKDSLLEEALDIVAAIAPVDFRNHVLPYLYSNNRSYVSWSDGFDRYVLSFIPFEKFTFKEPKKMSKTAKSVRFVVKRTTYQWANVDAVVNTLQYNGFSASAEEIADIRLYMSSMFGISPIDFNRKIEPRIINGEFGNIVFSDFYDAYVIEFSDTTANEMTGTLIIHNRRNDRWSKNTMVIGADLAQLASWVRHDVHIPVERTYEIVDKVKNGKPFTLDITGHQIQSGPYAYDVYFAVAEKVIEPTKKDRVDQSVSEWR